MDGIRRFGRAVKKLLRIGCKKCGAGIAFDDYCMDCWPGYDNCFWPGCNHYQCEHGFGDEVEVVYVSDDAKAKGMNVGDKLQWPTGCLNAGCDCPGFMTKDQLVAMLDKIGHARRDVYWELSQLPGVADVDVEVGITVNATTKMKDWKDREARSVVYQKELELSQKHRDVLFDFNVTQHRDEE